MFLVRKGPTELQLGGIRGRMHAHAQKQRLSAGNGCSVVQEGYKRGEYIGSRAAVGFRLVGVARRVDV